MRVHNERSPILEIPYQPHDRQENLSTISHLISYRQTIQTALQLSNDSVSWITLACLGWSLQPPAMRHVYFLLRPDVSVGQHNTRHRIVVGDESLVLFPRRTYVLYVPIHWIMNIFQLGWSWTVWISSWIGYLGIIFSLIRLSNVPDSRPTDTDPADNRYDTTCFKPTRPYRVHYPSTQYSAPSTIQHSIWTHLHMLTPLTTNWFRFEAHSLTFDTPSWTHVSSTHLYLFGICTARMAGNNTPSISESYTCSSLLFLYSLQADLYSLLRPSIHCSYSLLRPYRYLNTNTTYRVLSFPLCLGRYQHPQQKPSQNQMSKYRKSSYWLHHSEPDSGLQNHHRPISIKSINQP